jgi:hypothetical protein
MIPDAFKDSQEAIFSLPCELRYYSASFLSPDSPKPATMHLQSFLTKKPAIAILLIITITGALAYTLQQSTNTSPAHLTSISHAVRIFLNGDAVGDHPGWNNSSPGPTITVTTGETVILLLNATDILLHSWFIDTQRNYTPDPNGISSPDFSLSTTKTLNFTFTPVIGQNIPAAGNWTYRCKYHPFPYMYGTIRILQAQTPEFTITASPDQITTTTQTTATTTITVNPTSSFTGTVNLASQGTNGLATTIAPQTINNGIGTATLEIKAPSPGNYTATVTATSGDLIHSLNVTVQATDFTINVNPNMTIARINKTTASTLTMEEVNGFSETITLTTNSTFCTLSQNMITGSGNATLSCNFTATGQFTVQIIGTTGSTTHTVTAVYIVTHSGHQKNPKHHSPMINLENLGS